MKHALILLSLLFAVPLAASAQTHRLGSVSIELTDAPDLQRIPAGSPLMAAVDAFVPPGNMSLAAYTEPSVVNKGIIESDVLRVCSAQVQRQHANTDMSEAEFAGFRQAVRQALNDQAQMAQLEARGNALLDRSSERISAQAGKDIHIQTGRLGPQPPHVDDARMFAFTMTADTQAREGQVSETTRMAVTSTAMRVRNRLIYLYCVDSAERAAWTRDVSRRWAEGIQAANRD